MSAPSSASSPSDLLEFESPSPHPTTYGTDTSPPSTQSQTGKLEYTSTNGRKPILVTGIPNSNHRQKNGNGRSEYLDLSNEDIMPRIPITTPHTPTTKASSFIRTKSNVGRVIPVNKKKLELKGISYKRSSVHLTQK